MPYVFGGLLLFVAMMFGRSRFALLTLLLLGTYWIIQQAFQTELSEGLYLQFQALHLVVGIGLLLIAAIPEKGIRHPLFLVVLMLLATGFYLVWQGAAGNWLATTPETFEPWLTPWAQDQHWLSQGVLAGFASVCVIVLSGLVWRRDAASRACALASIAMLVVVWSFDQPLMSSVMYGSALFAMTLLFLQDNYLITYMDALTGIPGRRSLEDYLPSLGRRYAIAMLDVDHFKKFNDTHGHDVGDQVLKLVASQVNRVQGGGRAFRYGGEEFTIVFPGRDAQASFVFLEAVRDAIAHYEMVLRESERDQNSEEARKLRGKKQVNRDRTISVTISIGVASSEAGASTQDIIKKADEALYAAKQNGRNQTVSAEAMPKPKARGRAKKAA